MIEEQRQGGPGLWSGVKTCDARWINRDDGTINRPGATQHGLRGTEIKAPAASSSVIKIDYLLLSMALCVSHRPGAARDATLEQTLLDGQWHLSG
ncbi:hypothetical protein VTK56DRAFT_1191 [Thermocarpiscus australiensis]